jgi:hypothetical protein
MMEHDYNASTWEAEKIAEGLQVPAPTGLSSERSNNTKQEKKYHQSNLFLSQDSGPPWETRFAHTRSTQNLW